MHVCEKIYQISGAKNYGAVWGDVPGICRITGAKSSGVLFEKWVKKTFNDYAFLKPGTIISNEALFCFDEQSEFIKLKTGRDKPQRFRTYSHIVHNGEWYCFTKADKERIFNLICNGAEIVSLNDTGQKHVFFKHKQGMWQIDDLFVTPDIKNLKLIHKTMCDLMRAGFSQDEIICGNYKSNRIFLCGLEKWSALENTLKQHRGSGLFMFASWMLFISEEDKKNVQAMYKKSSKKQKGQIVLWT